MPPATRLKSAIDEAPNPNPANVSAANTSIWFCEYSSEEYPNVKPKYVNDNPSIPNPTTVNAAMEPEQNRKNYQK